ncbi:MAG: UbiD family decarboxylase [Chloroflexi bacterium]|nr:UbiD family decarboxylase [Chloroflexota bacterium]
MGELKKVDGADWDLEIGAITMLSWARRDRPALLFDHIKGYPAGFRVLTGSTSTPNRVALTLHLPKVASTRELVTLLREKLNTWVDKHKEYSPKIVSRGPALENIQAGDKVNLLQFPIPKFHEEDGGRYIGTGDAVITRDPDTGEINVGTYRMQLFDEKTAGLFMVPGRHGRVHYEKYFARNQPCPVVVSIGHHPLIFRVASNEMPAGAEMGVIGAIQGSPLEVIIDELTGLPFPAHSEIVLAGWCRPGNKRLEGPFGEWTGYYASKPDPAPVFEVERVYHRNDPILLGSPPGRAPSDSSYFSAVMRSALLQKYLSDAGVPDVRAVWASEEGGTQLIITSIKQRYAGHAKQAAILTSQSSIGTNLGRYVIVVDEDIEPSNLQEVLWAVCTRSDPEKDIDILRRTRSNPLDPMLRRPAKGGLFNSVAIIDACKPFEWKDEFPQEISISPELIAKVKQKFGEIVG